MREPIDELDEYMLDRGLSIYEARFENNNDYVIIKYMQTGSFGLTTWRDYR